LGKHTHISKEMGFTKSFNGYSLSIAKHFLDPVKTGFWLISARKGFPNFVAFADTVRNTAENK
jgi:hypothetical protein